MATSPLFFFILIAGVVMIVAVVGLAIFFLRVRSLKLARAPPADPGEPKPRLEFTGYYGEQQPDHGVDAHTAPRITDTIANSRQRLSAALPPLPPDAEIQVV